ncbi:MAG: hypothetical protein LLF97_04385 [Planctomycetaceae bacterium]|nr:hypothetical protein [Planctomycetaceae bacterium]
MNASLLAAARPNVSGDIRPDGTVNQGTPPPTTQIAAICQRNDRPRTFAGTPRSIQTQRAADAASDKSQTTKRTRKDVDSVKKGTIEPLLQNNNFFRPVNDPTKKSHHGP